MDSVLATKELDRPGKIIVTGIPKNESFTEADLEKEFSPFGRITEVNLVKNKRTNVLRGFAFITYENPKDAADAMTAMEGKNLGGEKSIHCEQAVLGAKMRQQNAEEESKGRGRGRGGAPGRGRGGDTRGRGDMRGRGGEMGGRGRGGEMWGRGRGREMRGRGGEMRGRGGFREDFGGGRRGDYEYEDYGPGGYGREEGEGYRRGPYGGREVRGGRGGGAGFRGGRRGGEFYEEDYGMEEDVRGHGPPRPALLERGGGRGGRGGLGRKTLLPNPNMGGGPPQRHGHYEGGDDYYHEGVGGGYEEGGYDYNEYGEQDEYSEHYNERGGPPMRGGRMPPPHRGRRGGVESQRRGMDSGRRGIEPPEQRLGLMDAPRSRGGMESHHRPGLIDMPLRRGGRPKGPLGGGHDFELEGAHRLPPEKFTRPADEDYGSGGRGKPWITGDNDDYGYQDQGQEPSSEDYYDNGYQDVRSAQRVAPGGRLGPGRGGIPPLSGQRRRPLLGDDPYAGGEIASDHYGQPLSHQTRQDRYEEEDGYNATPHSSYGRRPPPASSRQPLAHPDDRYRERGLEGASMRGGAAAGGGAGGRAPRRHPQGGDGERYEDEGYYDKSGPGARRDDFREQGRRPHQEPRGFDSSARKRPVEEQSRDFSNNIAALHRQYESMMDRTGGGPPAVKRERYEGYY